MSSTEPEDPVCSVLRRWTARRGWSLLTSMTRWGSSASTARSSASVAERPCASRPSSVKYRRITSSTAVPVTGSGLMVQVAIQFMVPVSSHAVHGAACVKRQPSRATSRLPGGEARPVPVLRSSAAPLSRRVMEVEDLTGAAAGSAVAQRLAVDPETVESDLIKLILTIVELLRQLMERTAVHRVDQGDLGEDEEEHIGMTLMILQRAEGRTVRAVRPVHGRSAPGPGPVGIASPSELPG